MTTLGDLTVSRIGLGCAAFSLDLAAEPDRAIATVRAAVAAGVTLLDTALAYTPAGVDNHNERLVRSVLTELGSHERIVVATKGGHYRSDDTFPVDGRPATLVSHCDRSLRALGVDRIDCYHLHWPDPRVPIEDSVGALAGLREAGKIASIGISNVTLEQVRQAQRVAPIASVQNRLSVFDQTNLDVVEHCHRTGAAFLAYSPLRGTATPRLAAIARRHGVSVQRIALAWLLALGPHVAPIVGATRPGHAIDAAAAVDLTLTAADLAELTGEPSPVPRP